MKRPRREALFLPLLVVLAAWLAWINSPIPIRA